MVWTSRSATVALINLVDPQEAGTTADAAPMPEVSCGLLRRKTAIEAIRHLRHPVPGCCVPMPLLPTGKKAAESNRAALLLETEHRAEDLPAGRSSSAAGPSSGGAGSSSGGGGAAAGSNDAMKHVQSQVDGVKTVMKENVNQMVANMDRSQALENSSSQLADSAKTFHSTARKAQRHFWMQNLKFKLALGGGFFLLLIIILAASGAFGGGGSGDDGDDGDDGDGGRRLSLLLHGRRGKH